MGALTEHLPKPLVEVHGKPILWYAFMSLYRYGFRNFILPLGYRGTMIETYFKGVAHSMGCNAVCVDTGEDSSVADRIRQISSHIPNHGDFFLINSDTIFDFDIDEMYEVHRNAGALVTLASVEVISAWGLILLDGEKLVGFDRQRKVRRLLPREHGANGSAVEGLVYSGLAWLNKDALDRVDLRTCADFETSLYGQLIEEGRSAHYRLEGRWFPIDTPKDLDIVNLNNVEDRHSTGQMARAVKDRLALLQTETP